MGESEEASTTPRPLACVAGAWSCLLEWIRGTGALCGEAQEFSFGHMKFEILIRYIFFLCRILHPNWRVGGVSFSVLQSIRN